MDDLVIKAALLRAEAAKARRMAAAVSDPLTQGLLAEYAQKCEQAADLRDAEVSRA